jgi:hypothetical protein
LRRFFKLSAVARATGRVGSDGHEQGARAVSVLRSSQVLYCIRWRLRPLHAGSCFDYYFPETGIARDLPEFNVNLPGCSE